MNRKTIRADIQSTNHGSLITIEPLTKRGTEWIAENVDSVEAMNGEVFHAEYRMALDILEGALRDGLMLKDATTNRTAVR